MRPLPILLAACSWLVIAAAPPPSEPFTPSERQAIVAILRDALKTDPSILRDAVVALQADEARRQDEAARDKLARIGPQLIQPADPVAGNPLGDVAVIEFYDTRCPYCRRMKPVIAELLRTDPNLKLVAKDMPILGPASELESRALLAAQSQDGYFKLQQAVMRTSGTPTRDSLGALAASIGLDAPRLLRDMDDPAVSARLQANIAAARQIGVEGTPAFVIGDQLIPGAADIADLRQAIDLARAAPGDPKPKD